MDLVIFSTSLSFFGLFLTLWIYGYEIMYRYVVLLVSVMGLKLPVVYFIPYGLIAWRIYVGANVSTRKKLYIGRCVRKFSASDDPSDASTHWIVAMDDEYGNFLYTHAVGHVILGEGIKKKFKRASSQELVSKYTLHHVGYVTKKKTEERMEEVVELEPMKSGNTCQEYAVDIAFQLSSSRTYTFMKIMTIPRARNIVFLILLCISILAFVTQVHWIFDLLNAIVLCNAFVCSELSRIGFLNTRIQTGYLPVIRAYLNYPKWNDFLQLGLLTLVMLILYVKVGMVETAFIGFVLMLIIAANS